MSLNESFIDASENKSQFHRHAMQEKYTPIQTQTQKSAHQRPSIRHTECHRGTREIAYLAQPAAR